MEVPLFIWVAVIHGLAGIALGFVYAYRERIRTDPVVHALTAAFVFVVTTLAVIAARPPAGEAVGGAAGIFDSSVAFFAFLGSSLCYVPTAVFIGVHYWGVILERILAPGSRSLGPERPASSKEWWDLLRVTCEGLRTKPNDVRLRLRLARVYYELGYFDSASFEYSKAAEWIPRGYAHSQVLYKAAYILAERKKDVRRAIPILRRIVRLYPKSYFAAYARRVINRFEARPEADAPSSPEPRPEKPR